jgi:hypothetical protein
VKPSAIAPAATAKTVPLQPVTVRPFGDHAHQPVIYAVPQQINSGVWLVTSSVAGVFLSGPESSGLPDGIRREGRNGTMWLLDGEPDTRFVRAFERYRPDRILVMAPGESLERTRTLWSAFKGNSRDATLVTPLGKIANADLSAILILKAMIDRKLIEAGWWKDAELRIDAANGNDLEIAGASEIRAQIVDWIRAIAATPPAEADFVWAREAAFHRLNDMLPHIQALLWQRVPEYSLLSLDSITAGHLQDAAKAYF